MNRRPEDLLDDIEALKRKTEQNRQMATDAQEAAEAALNNTTDTQTVRLLTHMYIFYMYICMFVCVYLGVYVSQSL